MFFLNISAGLLLYNDISERGKKAATIITQMTFLNVFFEMIKDNKVLVEEFLVVADKRLC